MSQTQQFRGVQTRIVRPDAHTIRGLYHDTCVAQLQTHPITGERAVRLNHGGWKTAMVKQRMNQFAHEFCFGAFTVSQEKGEWFVNIRAPLRENAPQRLVYHTQTITFTI